MSQHVFQEIDQRFGGIEEQIKSQVEKTDRYLHEMRHETREELQALRLAGDDNREVALGSVSKVHTRVDQIAQSVGELRGQMSGVSEQLSGIRNLLMQGGRKGT